ncbi:Rap1a/Tai family immunity protein [Pseudomonas congelans]|uniref:Rap1a/Tai family immunity protein n=2 Tax=Pseudomonas congelans TaxID=200452 RepID=UPI001185B5D5|nr:Rap1a/Tai family immunity protein [Pseudomonas congelans]
MASTTQRHDHDEIDPMVPGSFFRAQYVHKPSRGRTDGRTERSVASSAGDKHLMRSMRFAGGLVLASLCASAHGAFFSGHDLQQPLREIRQGRPLTAGQMQALGYVQGVYDANAGLLFCSQEGVDAGEVVQTVNAYLLTHLQMLDQPASVGLTAAFIARWPCRRQH